MQSVTVNLSSDVLVRLGAYACARLAVDARTAELAPLLKTRTDGVQAAWRARQDAGLALIPVQARADAADWELDAAIKSFADALYNACGRSRDGTRYRRVLPNGQAAFTQPRLFDQIEAASQLLHLFDAAADDPVVQAHRPAIEAGLAGLKATLEPYKDSLAAEQKARLDETLARTTFAATYNSTYGLVLGAGLSKGQAEGFFLRYVSRAPHVDDVDDTPTPAPVG